VKRKSRTEFSDIGSKKSSRRSVELLNYTLKNKIEQCGRRRLYRKYIEKVVCRSRKSHTDYIPFFLISLSCRQDVFLHKPRINGAQLFLRLFQRLSQFDVGHVKERATSQTLRHRHLACNARGAWRQFERVTFTHETCVGIE